MKKTKAFIKNMVGLGVGSAIVGELGGSSQPFTTAGTMLGLGYAASVASEATRSFGTRRRKKRR